MSKNKCLVIGASSSICKKLIPMMLDVNFEVFLINKSPSKMDDLLSEMSEHLTNISYLTNINFSEASGSYSEVISRILIDNKFSHIFINHGVMYFHSELSSEKIFDEFNCNLTSIGVILHLIESNSSHMNLRQIIVVGSIAGDMGKEKNPTYDATKAGLHALCEGYAQRFKRIGINLLLVKPGNIISPMTGFNREGLLWSTPKKVANEIFRFFNSNKRVIYTPGYWWLVMSLVKLLPRKFFLALGLGNSNS